MPVVEHYERQGKLAKISAVPPPEEVGLLLMAVHLNARDHRSRHGFTCHVPAMLVNNGP